MVDPAKWSSAKTGVLKGVRIPLRPHFGCLGLTQKEAEDRHLDSALLDVGGNVDDWRFGKGATLDDPVSIDGAYFSVGDTHAAMGVRRSFRDGHRVVGVLGVFQFVLHKKETYPGKYLAVGPQLAAPGNKGGMGGARFQ